MTKIYLQKAIAEAGICSRRKAEELIRRDMVTVNCKTGELGQKVNILEDSIVIGGKRLQAEKKVYYLVNKPIGYSCTVSDGHAKKKVIDLVPERPKVWPVGRLDKNSRGLIILTNDGELTNRLTHPSFEHEKEYEVEVNEAIRADFLKNMAAGIKLEEGTAKAYRIKKISKQKFSMVLHQGWKRQIRRMLEKCGYNAVDLKRVRIGNIWLEGLEDGEYKEISKSQITNYK